MTVRGLLVAGLFGLFGRWAPVLQSLWPDVPDINFSEAVEAGIQLVLEAVTNGFEQTAQNAANTVVTQAAEVPLPVNSPSSVAFVYTPPSGQPWADIYDKVFMGEMTGIGLILLVVAVQGRQLARIFGVGSHTVARTVKKRAWTGGMAIICWYYIAMLVLLASYIFTEALAVPPAQVGFKNQTLIGASISSGTSTAGLWGVKFLLAFVAVIPALLVELLFILRTWAIYIYLYIMPVLIALIYGQYPVISDYAERLAKAFVPWVFLSVPLALYIRAIDYVYDAVGSTNYPGHNAGVGEYLLGIAFPVFALFIVWKTFKTTSPAVSAALETGASVTTKTAGTAALGATAVASGGASAATMAASGGASSAAGAASSVGASGGGGGGGAGSQAAKGATKTAGEAKRGAQRTAESMPGFGGSDSRGAGDWSGGERQVRRTENDP